MPSKYEKTPKRKLARLTASFIRSSGTTLTKEDFINKFLHDKSYLDHYYRWIESNCDPDYSPSLKVINVSEDLSCLNNFSITFASLIGDQSQKLKERYLKEKYGVTNVSKLKSVSEKRKQTCKTKYGTFDIFSDEVIKGKRIKTYLKNYGVEHPSKSSKVREKTKQTLLNRYGVDHNLKIPEVREDIRKTNIKKYGFPNPTQSPENKSKRRKTCIDRGQWRELPTGETPKEFSKNTTYSYKTCLDLINKLGFDVAENYLKDGSKSLTSLEKTVSILTQLTPLTRISLVNKRKPDFKLNDSTYLDVDGLYFHSELVQKDKYYHLTKRQDYEKHELRLIQLREDEITYKPQIVKSLINNVLNKDITTVFARKCLVKFLDPKMSRTFVNDNHLQGFGRHPILHLGLMQEDDLLQLLTLSSGFKPGEIFIERFCTKQGYRVVGGFSKLLSRAKIFCRHRKLKKIITFCDLRYSNGAVYEKAGFTQVSEKVSWKWTDLDRTYPRLSTAKDEVAYEKGLVKIYDAGQRKYEMEI